MEPSATSGGSSPPPALNAGRDAELEAQVTAAAPRPELEAEVTAKKLSVGAVEATSSGSSSPPPTLNAGRDAELEAEVYGALRPELPRALPPPTSAREAELEAEVAALRLQLQTLVAGSGGSAPGAGAGVAVAAPVLPSTRCQCCGGGAGGCATKAWAKAWRTFALTYGARAGMAVVMRAASLVRSRRPAKLLDVNALVGEAAVVYRADAVRLGLFCGGFVGGYHLLRCRISAAVKCEPERVAKYAGAGAGVAILFLTYDRRKTLSMYLLARFMQSWYNSAKKSGRFHFWGSDWEHGDALLVSLTSAHIMYAYVMRPDTLSRSFWEFIVKTGPIDKPVLAAVRANCRNQPIDTNALVTYCSERGMSAARVADATPPFVHCDAMHGQSCSSSCVAHNWHAVRATFRKSFPFYVSIHLVPFVVFNLKKALHDPLGTLARTTSNAVRSTCFISAFVGLYMASACATRATLPRDHRFVYYAAGLLAGTAVFIEKKSRRSELALYLLPRAVESAFLHLVDRNMAVKVPFGEVALFAACMSGLMHYYENEPDTLAPFLRGLLERFMAGIEPAPKPPKPTPSQLALEACLQPGDIPGTEG